MTLDELIARLVEILVRGSSDPESDHLAADEALLKARSIARQQALRRAELDEVEAIRVEQSRLRAAFYQRRGTA